MGLFGLGKKKEDDKKFSNAPSHLSQPQQTTSMPSLPEFPSLDEEEVSGFPKYEPTVADIKKEVAKSNDDDVFIPTRNQDTNKKMVSATQVQQSVQQSFEMPSVSSSKRFSAGEEKPLFVKIDSYKQAMHTLDALKAKLEDAEEVLRAFEDIKSQEDMKLESWKRDLQNMKDKLFSIDKELFEV